MARTGNSDSGADVTGFGAEVELDRVANAGEKSVLAFAHLHSRLLRNALEINAELMDFARKRLGEDIEASEKFSHCKSVGDAVEVMNGFCQNAVRDYAEESNRIVRMSSDATRRSMEETAREAEEASRG